MKGFDSKWRDVPHFIIGITQEIWEDRQIASLTHRYAPGLIVRSPASVVVDNTRVIAATMATLAEFPDRQLPGEDVIWCEDPILADDDSDAFLSSHRSRTARMARSRRSSSLPVASAMRMVPKAWATRIRSAAMAARSQISSGRKSPA